MAHPVAVSDNSFQSEVVESQEPVLVDFWAEWCGPCRMMAPVLDKIANEYEGSLKITKLDVDHNQQSAMKFGVQSIPTMILFKDGKEVERLIGYMPQEKLLGRIKPHLNTGAAAKA